MRLPYENATSGDKRSHNFIDISGKSFGEWTVLSHSGNGKWECKCSCGKVSVVGGAQLRSGKSARCKSCANVGRAFSHGQASEKNGFTHKYRAWLSMLCRTSDKTSPRAKWYSDVPVHPEWKTDFASFNTDVPEPPSDEHTLDRIKGELGYVPGNVRWATKTEQARNRRSNRMLTIDGETMCISAWAERLGIGDSTLRYRLKHGIPPSGKTILETATEQKLLPDTDKSS